MRSPCIRRDEIVNLFNTNLKGATAHTGVEPCVGPKTIVMGFPCVMIISLLTLAKYTSRFAAPKGVNVREVGQAKASQRRWIGGCGRRKCIAMAGRLFKLVFGFYKQGSRCKQQCVTF